MDERVCLGPHEGSFCQLMFVLVGIIGCDQMESIGILGLCCAGPGLGLDDLCEPLPTQDVL